MEKYNGWKNRATWNLALWLNNDENLYRSLLVKLANYKAVNGKRLYALKAKFIAYSLLPYGETPDGDSFFDVNFAEIASMMREMME